MTTSSRSVLYKQWGIHIADYFAHHRAAAAVISADGLEFSDEQLAMICDAYDGEDKGDHYTVNGIDFYPNNGSRLQCHGV
jgi:hypothetical protein